MSFTVLLQPLAAITIPSNKAPPFFIAAFLGKGKPTYDFWDDFIDEIKKLSPLAEDEPGKKRTCCVELLCVICDSPVPFWLTGRYHCG